MASLIRSSRSSAISLFDTVTGVATTVSSALESANLGMDILHTNVRAAHHAATKTSRYETAVKVGQRKAEIAKSYAEHKLDIQRSLAKDPELKAIYEETMRFFGELDSKAEAEQAKASA